MFSVGKIIGSYLLLNSPSIGYVWVMRVFLLMALVIPIVYNLLSKANFYVSLLSIFGIIAIQILLIECISSLDNKVVRFILDEFLLYTIGYLPLAILGLKIREFSSKEQWIFLILTAIVIISYLSYNEWVFNPNKFKYPPSSLYLLYGLFASALLWTIKNPLSSLIRCDIFNYLSKNSMWIYLWHIVPVYLIFPIDWIDNTWFLRYLIVVFTAIGLYWIYSKVITVFPENIRKILQ